MADLSAWKFIPGQNSSLFSRSGFPDLGSGQADHQWPICMKVQVETVHFLVLMSSRPFDNNHTATVDCKYDVLSYLKSTVKVPLQSLRPSDFAMSKSSPFLGPDDLLFND
jgi:hypothetical protein